MQAFDVAAIIQRLEQFALGDNPEGMSDAQIEACLGLLDRVMPNLTEVEVIVREGHTIATTKATA
ncbi:MAG TPA: hypothetical protein VHT00_01235 [Stellaceae bacterium]|jgi:hypothetical protein|nr:hypothetical protein [Stellaceae bacterium]